jgi:hypothetical protein
MPSTIVVGIVPTCDPAYVAMLVDRAALDASRVRVLSTRPCDEESPIGFVHVADFLNTEFAGMLTRGTGVLDLGGTAVPGLRSLTSLDAFSHPRVREYLTDAAIPRGEAEGYNDAIADGRCVVLYTCGPEEDAAQARATMESIGALDVRAY